MQTFLALIDENGWHPGIGDPSLGGWFTVAAYIFAAFLCWREARFTEASPKVKEKMQVFWLLYAFGLVALGVNKQLDLQSWFTLAGKNIAIAGGWYEHRRTVQAIFLMAITLIGLLCLASLSWLVRGFWSQNTLALAGGLFLLCFIVIRAASFHHVDQLLGLIFAGLKLNWILELSGIALIIAGALRHSASRSPVCPPVPA